MVASAATTTSFAAASPSIAATITPTATFVTIPAPATNRAPYITTTFTQVPSTANPTVHSISKPTASVTEHTAFIPISVSTDTSSNAPLAAIAAATAVPISAAPSCY